MMLLKLFLKYIIAAENYELAIVTLTDSVMISFQYVSTVANFLPSSGIWAMISSELKIGSKYNHVACTFSH